MTCRSILLASVAFLASVVCAGAAAAAPALHPNAEPLPSTHQGPFVTTADGAVLCIDAQDALSSRDEGKTWKKRPLFGDPSKYKVSNERALLRTRDGVVIAAWMNLQERNHAEGFRWGGDESEFRQWILPTYVCRSLDDGKTWQQPIKINTPWCGCIHSMIETTNGRIVLAAQEVIPAWRHAAYVFVSDDQGKTWKKSNILDIGTGRHDHAGSIEGTLVELGDGSIYQLLRTETGYLYEATSKDDGLTWEDFKSSGIRSVTCCAQLYRLADSRIALLWNHPVRFRPTDRHCREELSIAFSADECKTWSRPVVVATNYASPGAGPGGRRVSYPYLYERRPGEFWITTMQGGLRMKVHAADLVASEAPQPDTIVMFGDSTTATRPAEVDQVYAGRVRDALRAAGSDLMVINSGVSADTTTHARLRFDEHVAAFRPKLLVVQFGMNDAAIDVWKNPPAEKPRVPVGQSEENLRWMVERARAGGAKVILLTAAPVRWTEKLKELYGKPPYDVNDPLGFDKAAIKEYNDVVRKLAQELNLPLVDVYTIFNQRAESTGQPIDALLVPVGISAPNDKGHEVITEALLPVIRSQVRASKQPQ
jgi:sialidase-1